MQTTSCPVCGEPIAAKAKLQLTQYETQGYTLCSPDCKQAFEKVPERYTRPADHRYESALTSARPKNYPIA